MSGPRRRKSVGTSNEASEMPREKHSSATRLFVSISFLPNSIRWPRGAMTLRLACRSGPGSELSMTSTPRPSVAARTAGANEASRLLKMRSAGMPYSRVRRSRFSCDPAVA